MFVIGVVEKLHEAAYKNALTNSLYCPDFNEGKISSDQVKKKVLKFHLKVMSKNFVGLHKYFNRDSQILRMKLF